MKIFIAILVAVVLTLGITFGARYYLQRRADPAADATGVRVEPAGRGDLVELVSAPGQVQPRNKVSISARVSARIVALPFEEGQTVSKGDPKANPPQPASVLVRLDATDLEAALKSAEARRSAEASQIEVAKAKIAAQTSQIAASRVSLAEAERDLRRQKELLESKDVSQAAVDSAQSKVDTLVAQLESAAHSLAADRASLMVMQHNLEAAEAEIARARDALSYTTIASPIDGVVTRLNAKVGELVVTGTMNNPGTVIMEVADLSKMLVVARVDETSIANVKVGQKVRVRMQAYGERVFEGTVDTIALTNTDERDGSKYYKTEILLDTAGTRVFSGLTADADIQTQQHKDVLKVPSQAVLGRPIDELPPEIRKRPEVDATRTTATVVYRFADGKAVITPVTIGPSDVTHTVIKAGLNEGDRIIVGPYKVLEGMAHDQRVKDLGQADAKPKKP